MTRPTPDQLNDRLIVEERKRSYRDILGEQIHTGSAEIDRAGSGLFLSGVSAGLDISFSVLLTAATRDTMSQILCVWLVAASIGFAGLHHSIAGSAEVLSGVFVGQGASPADFVHFLLWTTAGNAVGGIIFAVLKYAHAIRGHKYERPSAPT